MTIVESSVSKNKDGLFLHLKIVLAPGVIVDLTLTEEEARNIRAQINREIL
jgi:hypothetical protein